MAKFIALCFLLLCGNLASAAFLPKANPDSLSENLLALPHTNTGASKVKPQKLSLIERWLLKSASKKAMKMGIFDKEQITEGFHLGAFLLGFFTLGLAYLVSVWFTKDSNFDKWCAIGASLSALVWLILAFTVFNQG